MVILAAILFFESIRKNPIHQLGAILGINLFFLQQHVHLALYGYGDRGVQILHTAGFHFYPQEDERYVKILSLGMASLTALGRGEEYIEGSAIIPIMDPLPMTGVVLTGWIEDPQQMDPRLDGKTYLALLVLLDRQFDFLFRNRQNWEIEFRNFLQSKNVLQDISEQNILDFTKKTLIMAALTFPRST